MVDLKLDYKKKKYLLIGFLLFFAVVIYQKVLKNSLSEFNRYLSYITDEKNKNQSDETLVFFKDQIRIIEETIGKGNFNKNTIQQEILDFLSIQLETSNSEIVFINPIHNYKIEEYLMVTNSIVLKGGYNSLIDIIHEVEYNFKRSKLKTVRFYEKKNYSSKRKELYVELFFQNFKKIKN